MEWGGKNSGCMKEASEFRGQGEEGLVYEDDDMSIQRLGIGIGMSMSIHHHRHA